MAERDDDQFDSYWDPATPSYPDHDLTHGRERILASLIALVSYLEQLTTRGFFIDNQPIPTFLVLPLRQLHEFIFQVCVLIYQTQFSFYASAPRHLPRRSDMQRLVNRRFHPHISQYQWHCARETFLPRQADILASAYISFDNAMEAVLSGLSPYSQNSFDHLMSLFISLSPSTPNHTRPQSPFDQTVTSTSTTLSSNPNGAESWGTPLLSLAPSPPPLLPNLYTNTETNNDMQSSAITSNFTNPDGTITPYCENCECYGHSSSIANHDMLLFNIQDSAPQIIDTLPNQSNDEWEIACPPSSIENNSCASSEIIHNRRTYSEVTKSPPSTVALPETEHASTSIPKLLLRKKMSNQHMAPRPDSPLHIGTWQSAAVNAYLNQERPSSPPPGFDKKSNENWFIRPKHKVIHSFGKFCAWCRKRTHLVQSCPKLRNLTCWLCKRKGHIFRFCPDRIIPPRFQHKGIKRSFSKMNNSE